MTSPALSAPALLKCQCSASTLRIWRRSRADYLPDIGSPIRVSSWTTNQPPTASLGFPPRRTTTQTKLLLIHLADYAAPGGDPEGCSCLSCKRRNRRTRSPPTKPPNDLAAGHAYNQPLSAATPSALAADNWPGYTDHEIKALRCRTGTATTPPPKETQHDHHRPGRKFHRPHPSAAPTIGDKLRQMESRLRSPPVEPKLRNLSATP